MSIRRLSGSGSETPPEMVPAPGEEESQLTEEDLFRMKSLSSHNTLLSANETADQSIVSLADSTSNFGEHIDEQDADENEDFDEEPRMHTNADLQQVDGWVLNRRRSEQFAINEATVTVLKYPSGCPIPQCPPGEDPQQWKAAFEDVTVYLIGTAHFSKESQEDVRRTIAATQPDAVLVELCPARISILSMNEEALLKEAASLTYEKVATTIKQTGLVQGTLHVLLLSVSAHITRQLSMAPGGEFRAAHKAAQQLPMCRVALGDRPIQITLQRALSSLSLWQKIKFFYHIVISQFSTITPEEVEKCKEKDLLEQLLADMADDYPHLSKIFVDERDLYMTYVMHNLLLTNTIEKRAAWRKSDKSHEFQPLRMVSVVGIGHTPGIVSKWDEPADISQIIVIPERSLSSKIVSFTFRVAFYGGLAYLLYRGGSRVARRFAR